MERTLNPLRLLLAFIIAVILFAGVFFLGYTISYSKYRSVSLSQENIRYELLGLELEGQLLEGCDVFDPYYFSTELDQMGSVIGVLEERFGKNDDKVIKQKEVYSMLEIQHLLLIDKYNKNCNKTIPIVLFFYSNEENFIVQAEKMGFILSTYKANNKNIMIYSFDYSLNTNLINLLKKKYDITQANTIIINGQTKVWNLNNIDDLKKYLK